MKALTYLRQMMRTLETIFVFCAFTLATAFGQQAYKFENIVDNAPGSSFLGVAGGIETYINNSGVVPFQGVLRNGPTAFYSGSGAEVTKTVDIPSSCFTSTLIQGINNEATVVFSCLTTERSLLFYTGSSGQASLIGTESNALTAGSFDVSINDTGSVVYTVGLPELGSAIKLLSAGTSQTLADNTGAFAGMYFFGSMINNRGRVAFLAVSLGGTPGGIFIAGDTPLTEVFTSSASASLQGSIYVCINDSNVLAFIASSPTSQSLMLQDAQGAHIFASGSASRGSIGPFSLNNQNQIAFLTAVSQTSQALYFGPDPSAVKVIATGDPLFGSTVTKVSIGEKSLNDRGQIAFSYTLASGVQGIAIASPGGGAAPSIAPGGIFSAGAFGQFKSVAPGSWIEIYGSGLASNTRPWGESDFDGIHAPTVLDGTKVTIGGQAAFIDYISPGQINALVPSTVATGPQPLVVTTSQGTSLVTNITVNATQPGLLAPPTFALNGVQYAVALLPDGSYALPAGAIANVNSRPAKPGEIVTLYGVGFGPVVPDIPPGQLVQQLNTLASSVQVLIGGAAASLPYSGLAPNYTGLYQFNVVVPSVALGNSVPLTFTLGGVAGTQKLFIAVGN